MATTQPCRIAQERNNWYRLTRALEVVLHTGKPLAESRMQLETGLEGLQYDYRPFFLTRPRMTAFKRIDERVERMVSSTLQFMLRIFHVALSSSRRQFCDYLVRMHGHESAL